MLNMNKVPSQAALTDVTVTGDPVTFTADRSGAHTHFVSRRQRRVTLNAIATGIENLAMRDPDEQNARMAAERSTLDQWAMFMGFGLCRDFISPTVCTTQRTGDFPTNMREVYGETPTSLWATPPKLQVYIAVGEIAQTPDGAIGDIVCVADKYKRVVIRDAQGFLHRARKEKLVKPLRRDRAKFYLEFRGRFTPRVSLDAADGFHFTAPETEIAADLQLAEAQVAEWQDHPQDTRDWQAHHAAVANWTGSLTMVEAHDTSGSQGSSAPADP